MTATTDSRSTRRELSRRARDAFPTMGVFAIRSLASGQVRVKSSRNVPGAMGRIRFELRLRSHPDKALQAEWETHGPAGLAFEVLELVRQREDAEFDYAGELRLLEEMYRQELERGSTP